MYQMTLETALRAIVTMRHLLTFVEANYSRIRRVNTDIRDVSLVECVTMIRDTLVDNQLNILHI